MTFRYFDVSEFKCHCGCGRNNMASSFVTLLDELRDACGFPLRVSSGYRCPQYNAKVSKTGLDGPHTTGRAVDFAVRGKEAWELLTWAARLEFTGIGILQTGAYRFIHLDNLPATETRPRPVLWSY